jgi:hypothetical protein
MIEQQTYTKPRGWTRVLKIEQQTHKTKPWVNQGTSDWATYLHKAPWVNQGT